LADDTKKILVPVDDNGDGSVGNDFTAANADYGALPGVEQSGQDDLPVNPQQTVDNVERVSISSARSKVLKDTQINSRQPGNTGNLESDSQFLPQSRRPSTIDRPSQTMTIGQFLKKGPLGRRSGNEDQLGVDSSGNEIIRRTAGQIFSDVNTEPLGRQNDRPHGRSIAGTPGPANGDPEVQEGAGPVVAATVSGVLRMNRFAGVANKTFSPSEANPDNQVLGSLQPEVGAYNPEATDTASQSGKTIRAEELKSLGIDMLTTAAGIFSSDPAEREVQLGRSGVPARSIRPRNLRNSTINSEAFDVSKASVGEFNEPDDDDPITSFGQLNTPDITFAGLAQTEMKALADAIISVTAETVRNNDLITSLLDVGQPPSGPGNVPYTKGSFVEKPRNGGSTGRSGQMSNMDLGFVYTAGDFTTAVDLGMAILLGNNDTDIVSKSPANLDAQSRVNEARKNISSSPGFYVNFCRAVLRDAQTLNEKFAAAGDMAAGSLAGATAAIAILDVFRSSKIVACINTLATIGDAAIRATGSPYSVDQIVPSGEASEINTLNGMSSYNPASHAMKSRDGNKVAGGVDSMRLAWRNASTPSMYLLPAEIEYGSVINAASTLSNDSPAAAHGSMEGVTKAESSGRLPQEFVEAHERLLDAEYVPFYFHDLRTNEIISFHAFLGSLQDGFSANYNSTKAVGRAEPVQTYQSTARSISFNFFVAATSRDDFNELWFKINKLVTMLYPQYTQGREAGDPFQVPFVNDVAFGRNFIMPFSQVMAASPMIRLRIGDVVKTNFSKFNLSRLFGLGTSKLDPFAAGLGVPGATLMVYRLLFQGLGIVNNLPIPGIAKTAALNSADVQANVLQSLRMFKERARKLPTNISNSPTGYKIGDIVRLSFPSVRKLALADGSGAPNIFLNYKDAYAKVVSLPEFDKEGSAKTVRYKVQLSSTFEKSQEGTADLSGPSNTYFMNHHDASIVPGGLAKEKLLINGLRLATGAVNVLYGASVFAFLANNSNAVVRSFDESSGKGLPGFIKQLSFDWVGDDITWEVERGARAPKIFKVNVSFTPVHDIAPGLDHLGYNRAPVYPVGDVVNNISGKSGDWLDTTVDVRQAVESAGAVVGVDGSSASDAANLIKDTSSAILDKIEDWTS